MIPSEDSVRAAAMAAASSRTDMAICTIQRFIKERTGQDVPREEVAANNKVNILGFYMSNVAEGGIVSEPSKIDPIFYDMAKYVAKVHERNKIELPETKEILSDSSQSSLPDDGSVIAGIAENLQYFASEVANRIIQHSRLRVT